MIYAICSQATTDAVRGVLGDADTVQTVKDGRASLAEVQRLPIDTLILDVATIRSADDVLAYQTTVRQCPRIVLLAPDAVPGNKMIGQCVSYGIYDIVTDLDKLAQVIDGPAATIVQAARWIVRDLKQDRGKGTNTSKQLQKVSIIGRRTVYAVTDGGRRLGTFASSLFMSFRLKPLDRKAKKAASNTIESLKQDVNDEPALSALSEGNQEAATATPSNGTQSDDPVAITVPNPVSSAVPVWVAPQPMKPELQPDPQQPRRQSISYLQVLGVITVESWALSRALVVLAWRMAVLCVQLLPYALAAEVAVLLGYIPHWASIPAYGYWSFAHAVDPHVPSMQAAWHYVTHFTALVGGGKA